MISFGGHGRCCGIQTSETLVFPRTDGQNEAGVDQAVVGSGIFATPEDAPRLWPSYYFSWIKGRATGQPTDRSQSTVVVFDADLIIVAPRDCRMVDPKEEVAAAIARAQVDLLDALAQLKNVPAVEARSVAFTAHALSNYLTITGGAVELILRRLADHPDPELRVWLEGVQHATVLMNHTVSQLLSAAVTTEAKLRFEKVDLPLLVQRTCDYYQRIANRKTIRVIVDAAVDVPPAWTDRVAVASVLDNLLSNAIKYSQPHKRVWVQVCGEQGSVVCAVRDEGPGLSQEDQAKLFQKGMPLASKPTGGEVSTGYGLAVAKELIERLKGELWCKSELGQGCSFFFRVPVYQAPTSGPN